MSPEEAIERMLSPVLNEIAKDVADLAGALRLMTAKLGDIKASMAAMDARLLG